MRQTTIHEAPLLRTRDPLGEAVRTLARSGLPALPVVDEEGRIAGVFGERELIKAAMPGYVGTLSSAGFVRRSLDEALEARSACVHEPIAQHMNTEHVELPADPSDLQIAETFLHHRVLVLPVVDREQRVQGVVLRADFFREVAERVLGEPLG
jgi:CBS domain-containing protein